MKFRAKKPARSEKTREPLNRQQLEQAALGYLNRFDVSASKLRQYLRTRAKKAGGHDEAEAWIDALIERYLGSGVLDDARFARNLTSQLTARGKSTRAISQKLRLRGVGEELTSELLATRREEQPGAELEAALAYVRKRRLGPYRDPEKRAEFRQKDLASLARQGFSFDIARRALGPGASTDDEL